MKRTSPLLALILVGGLLLFGLLRVLRRDFGVAAMPGANFQEAEEPDDTIAAIGAPDPERVKVGSRPAPEKPSPPGAKEKRTVRKGRVRGTVFDQLGNPVAGGRVQLASHEKTRRIRRVGEDGGFDFQLLPPAEYLLTMIEAPEGYIAPWGQDRSSRLVDYEGFPKGFFAAKVEIPDFGVEIVQDLRVFRQATVTGFVLGPDGEAVPDVDVRITSLRPGLEGLHSDDVTDQEGRFQMEGVYPSAYRTSIYTRRVAFNHRYLTRPVPIDFEVSEGDQVELPHLRLGMGHRSVFGKVVNQDGIPFSGLEVLCYWKGDAEEGRRPHGMGSDLIRGQTDEEGGYRLEGLPAGPVAIQIAPSWGGRPGPAPPKLSFWVETIYLDLTHGPDEREAEARTAHESRPFLFKGTLDVDPDWLREKETTLRRIEVRVTMPGEDNAAAMRAEGIHPHRTIFREADLRLDKTGSFEWRCETPHEPVVFVVSYSRRGVEQRTEVPVYPEPSRTLEQRISFP